MKSPLTEYREANKQSLETFGRLFGVQKTTVRYWERKGVPPERVIEIERVTGIPRQKLCPKVFGEAA